jgi:pSer/pThr/pTyr-binding forkhead associated (FHA) protein
VIVCSQCKRENEDHFNFCLGCGANLKAQKGEGSGERVVCPACGAEVPARHVFCGKCGTRLEKPAAEEAPTAGVARPASSQAPRPELGARLVLINPDGSTGQVIDLHVGENVFGREQGPTVFRDDPFLSPKHAAFNLTGSGDLEVVDLDSLNGVYYRITDPTELSHQDYLRLGRQLLRFEELEEAEPMEGASEDGTRRLGAWVGDAWARLVRVSAPTHNSEAFLLTRPEEVIGRERGSILFRDDGFVSGRHARITVSGGRFYLEDLRSSNGTFLRVRGRRTLEHGDLLLLGQQPLRAFIEG